MNFEATPVILLLAAVAGMAIFIYRRANHVNGSDKK